MNPAFPLGPLIPLGDNYCTAVLNSRIAQFKLNVYIAITFNKRFLRIANFEFHRA